MRFFLFTLVCCMVIQLPVAAYAAPTTPVAVKVPAMERLLYYTDTDSGYASLKKNINKIDVLSPQAFTFDREGTVTASIAPRMMEVLKDHARVKLMPLIENEHFDLKVAHAVLTNEAAQQRIIDTMITIGTQNGYWGWQMDMEHMDAVDRPLYTAFSKKVAAALHDAGFVYSIAVTAKVSDDPKDYSEKSWNKWAGVFDYAPLAEAADFLSIMLYDQDDSIGPVSSLTWYNKVIAYAESVVPMQKLSIGIPLYGWEWIPGDAGRRVASHTYKYVQDQLKKKTVHTHFFNDVLGAGVLGYTVRVNGINQKRVLWYENLESFKLKYAAIEKAKARGFSAWALGQEDGRIWNVLSKR